MSSLATEDTSFAQGYGEESAYGNTKDTETNIVGMPAIFP
jgi:hypothetical protein